MKVDERLLNRDIGCEKMAGQQEDGNVLMVGFPPGKELMV